MLEHPGYLTIGRKDALTECVFRPLEGQAGTQLNLPAGGHGHGDGAELWRVGVAVRRAITNEEANRDNTAKKLSARSRKNSGQVELQRINLVEASVFDVGARAIRSEPTPGA